MPKITTTTVLAGVAGAAAVTLAGFGANAALAESTPTPTPSSSTSTQQPGTTTPDAPGAPGDRGGRGHGPGGMKGDDAAALATALGLDEAKVEAAITKVREANRPAERPAEGTAPSDADREARRTAYITALAKELGVSESTVSSALDKLQSDREAEHRTAMSQRLDTAVADGTLTASDKASVLKAFDAGVLGGPR